MKFHTLVSVLGGAALAAAAPAPEPQLDALLGLLGVALPNQNSAAGTGGAGIAPEVQPMKAKGIAPGSQRVKIRYGPYRIPSTDEVNLYTLTTGERGILTTVALAMKKPCENCGILEMLAGLEYPDGQLATVDTDAWLHHVVVMVSGQNRRDLTCPSGPLSMFGERIFASGNERTPIAFTSSKLKTVFPLRNTDMINMELELMNMEPKAKDTYFTLEYEYLPQIPAGYKETKTVWLDVTNCGDSNVYPPANKKQFDVSMQPWTSTLTGDVFFIMGHLHDGGTNAKVYRNNGVTCDSQAKYSNPAMANMHGMRLSRRDGPHDDSMPHIENMTICTNQFKVNKGDKLHVQALYDFDKHMGMTGDRGLTPVMGIANVFIAV